MIDGGLDRAVVRVRVRWVTVLFMTVLTMLAVMAADCEVNTEPGLPRLHTGGLPPPATSVRASYLPLGARPGQSRPGPAGASLRDGKPGTPPLHLLKKKA